MDGRLQRSARAAPRSGRSAGPGLGLALSLSLAGCANTPGPAPGGPPASPAAAGSAAESPAQAHNRLIDAFSTCNEAAFVAAYAPYFSLTTSNTRLAIHTADGLRGYLAGGCRSRPNPTAALIQQSVRTQGTQALLVGQYRFKVPAGSQAVEVVQNFTLLLERAGERWLIAAHHVSVAP